MTAVREKILVETGRIEAAEKWLAKMMQSQNIKTEVRANGKWVEDGVHDSVAN